MKKILLVYIFFPCTSFALLHLTNTSLLQLNDQGPDVQTLQVILNTDPDTQVATEGVGSKGKENWFFGLKTEDAVKRFQNKYGLPVTGSIDVATRKRINQYVDSLSVTKTIPVSTTTTPKENTNSFLPSTANPYLTEDVVPATTTKPLIQKILPSSNNPTFLDSMLNKYTNIFPTSTPVVTPNPINPTPLPPNLLTNPYLTPFQNPYLQPINPATNRSLPGLLGSIPGFGNNSPTNMFSQLQRQYREQSDRDAQQIQTSRLDADIADSGGWKSGWATVFGHNQNGSYDTEDNGMSACSIPTRAMGVEVVALPCSTLRQFFNPSQAKNLGSKVSCSTFNKKEIEVINTANGECATFPVVEIGPNESGPTCVTRPKVTGNAIDLTGTAMNKIKGGGKIHVAFRALKQGDTACQNKDLIPISGLVGKRNGDVVQILDPIKPERSQGYFLSQGVSIKENEIFTGCYIPKRGNSKIHGALTTTNCPKNK